MRRFLRVVLRILLYALLTTYGLLLVLAVFSDHLLFQPHAASYDLAAVGHTVRGPVETYRIATPSGAIAAIYFPNPAARYTLLYSHGNGEDVGDDLPILEEYRDAGFAVFAYDYNGYGKSEGRPTEANVKADVEAAYDFLTTQLHVPSGRIISFGHSLGAAAAIHLAASRPVAALIAQAPFESAFKVVTQVQIVPWDKFNNARAIRHVHCGVLVVQGRQDEVIPFHHGQRIFALANPPKQSLWLDRAGHNDVMIVARAPFLRAIQGFAASLPPRD